MPLRSLQPCVRAGAGAVDFASTEVEHEPICRTRFGDADRCRRRVSGKGARPTRTHNVRIYDRRFDFNSGAQDPGERVTISFPEPGQYEAFCGIHPAMRLSIEVE